MHTLNPQKKTGEVYAVLKISAKLFYMLKIVTSPSSKLFESTKVETEPIRN
jgi:hypothetical protein